MRTRAPALLTVLAVIGCAPSEPVGPGPISPDNPPPAATAQPDTTGTPGETAPAPPATPGEADMAAVRAQIEARLGNVTADELRMLRAICSHQGDRGCRDKAAAQLAKGGAGTPAPEGGPTTTTGPAEDDDWAAREGQVRAQLEPKVWGGTASTEEIRMLKAICAHQGDKACRDRATETLEKSQKKAP